MRNLFMAPRNAFRMEEGILSLLAGDLFRGTPIQRPLFFFKIVYGFTYLFNWRENRAALRRRRSSVAQGYMEQ